MTDVRVSQGPRGWTFTRDFVRGRIVVGGDRGVFSRVQLRAVAGLLDVPPSEAVQFVDAGSFELLAELEPHA